MVDIVKVGSELLVNSQTASFQDLPSITGLAGGGFVATWVDYSAPSGLGVAKAQIYNAAGVKVGGEFALASGASTDQSFPTVASLANGGFVVTWTEAGIQSDYKIKAQVYSAAGAVVTPAFLVNPLTWTQQGGNNLPGNHNPTITGLAGGGFVVTWQDYAGTAGDASGAGVLAQVYNAAGVPSGSAVRVNTQTTGDQTQPMVTSLASGGFVVTWMDGGASGTVLKAQLFDAAGAKAGGEFIVDAEAQSDQALPVVTGLSGGGFVVAWQDSSPATGEPDTLIRAQMFDGAGAKVGTTLVVSGTGAGERDFPAITSLPDGGFVVTWQHFVTATNSEIKAQFYDGAGAKVGSEITVNTVTSSYQERPVVSSLLGGGFVIAWGDGSGLGGDSDGTSIKAQVFSYGSYNLIVGTAAVNALTGTNGADHIMGLAGNDTLTGLGGNDRLDGGLGNDTMVGGLGDDTYVVDSASDVVSEAAGQGTDTVLTTRASYTLGSNVENLTFTDSAAHTGTGNTLNNTLTGGGGNDVLNGASGADRMIGGLGNDSYVVDNAGDTTIEAASAGTDTVTSSISWTLAAYVENLTLSGSSAISGTGNGDANVLTGNSGANTLTGLGGNDTLNGGTGADAMIGGLGDDSYVVDNAGDVLTELAGQGTDLVTASIAWTLTANFENLTLSGSASVAGTGNGNANVLTGNSGANVLTGLGGNDTLNGGSGNDTMIGGLDDDTYVVDASGDVVTELAGQGTDTVQTTLSSHTLAANVENLTFTNASAHSGTGNGLNNVITGNAGNDTLNGGAGTDTLIGGLGNDSYVIDVSGDVVTELAGQGTDLVTASASYTLSANIENLTLSGTAAINGTGNAEANVITGNSAANVLAGLDGSDTLTGGLGNDTLQGGIGTDRLTGGNGNDVLNGGAGADTFVFDTAANLSTNYDTLQDFVTGTDKLAFSRAVFTGFAATGAMSADAYWSGAGVNAAHDATDRLIYNTSTGVLWYDRDGTGSAAAVQVATLTGHPALAYTDFQIIA
ncbi:hypothetical protein [Novosphingobium sp. PASSN1]|uniref:beta strand repeat-containing protein n=1 Tax=Novosphingobium sp. PASSN1 TaxID=2015561 RepID=UPI000BD93FA0|nr:hypothetical protein [Novosphingobium sp. PASSN1]OYU33411.1 MAG: hypothetical protein CFE35_20375 [Novosphingobium sp. PASSN1]